MTYKGIEWVWFDLDDTIYDFSKASMTALRQVYAMHNLDRFFPTFLDWEETYHRHNSALWDSYNLAKITKEYLREMRFAGPLTDAGADGATIRGLVPRLDHDYLRLLGNHGVLVSGASDLIDNLRSHGKKIGLLSNGFLEVQYDKLRSSGISDRIDCVVLSDEIGINKPDRRLFDHALEKSGATAAGSMMIGDNPATDIAGAINAGWHAVLFDPDESAAPIPGVTVITSLEQAKMVED